VEWTNGSGEECRGSQRASPRGGNVGESVSGKGGHGGDRWFKTVGAAVREGGGGGGVWPGQWVAPAQCVAVEAGEGGEGVICGV
jgi:hypothetical protein